MWDFEIGRTIGIVLRTWPFVLLRVAVYTLITLAYIVATGSGAGLGYGAGQIFGGTDGPLTFAVGGGVIGFVLTSGILYLLREYILYAVKAGHIAVMALLIDRQPVPGGLSQLAYGRQVVEQRFAEANVLFVVDQLIKAILKTIGAIFSGIASFIPIPGLSTLVSFFNAVVRMSVTYVDEVILAYNIRIKSTTPFETARQGIVLYAQNGRTMVRNAVWLTVFMWLVGVVLFLLVLAQTGAMVLYVPGSPAGWAFVLSILIAWACISAFVEPFAIAALMQVYFKTIEGQAPDPEWERTLAEKSQKFRELKDRAAEQLGRTLRPSAGSH